MQANSLFITRHLSPDSPILALEKEGWRVWHESLLDFVTSGEPAPKVEVDWIFFSSPKTVQFFPWKDWPKATQIACLGPGTAQCVLNHQDKPADWIGNGIPSQVARHFSEIASNSSVLFPRAKHSRRSIQQLLPKHISQTDWVVYINRMKSPIDIPTTDLLVFTSPLNAENYYRHYPNRKELPSLAIGATTAQWLRSQGISIVIETATPSETSLHKSIMHWKKINSHE
ncbi:MAG: uroporphyrinogen-III synthase [Bacteroidota bacterium]